MPTIKFIKENPEIVKKDLKKRNDLEKLKWIDLILKKHGQYLELLKKELNENKNLIRSMKLELVWVDENQHEQKLDKTFRVLYPLFHAKQDDLNMANTGEGGMVPPPDPDQGIVQ